MVASSVLKPIKEGSRMEYGEGGTKMGNYLLATTTRMERRKVFKRSGTKIGNSLIEQSSKMGEGKD